MYWIVFGFRGQERLWGPSVFSEELPGVTLLWNYKNTKLNWICP